MNTLTTALAAALLCTMTVGCERDTAAMEALEERTESLVDDVEENNERLEELVEEIEECREELDDKTAIAKPPSEYAVKTEPPRITGEPTFADLQQLKEQLNSTLDAQRNKLDELRTMNEECSRALDSQ